MDLIALTFRYFRTRPMAWVAALFMAVMVAALVVVTSVMAGFRARIRENLRSFEPDLSISLRQWPSDGQVSRRIKERLSGEMKDAGGEIAALAARYEVDGMLRVRFGRGASRSEIKRLVRIRGIDWEEERALLPWSDLCEQVTDLQLRVREAGARDPLRESAVPGMIVGWRLGLGLGLATPEFPNEDEATLVSVRLGRDEKGEARATYSNLLVQCQGAVQTGRADHDASCVYIDREAFWELRYGADEKAPDAHFLAASLVDPSRVEEVAAELRRRHPGLKVETWRDRFRSLLMALRVETTVTTTVLFVIVSLAVVLLLGVLYMLVLEKRRDVGILRSMGMSRLRIVALFGGYGMLVGGIGVILGVISGVLLTRNLDAVCGWLYDSFGFQVFARGDGPTALPSILERGRVIAIAAGSLGMTLFAVSIAARKAGAMEPVDCLGDEF